ncbi:hypothetical protein, partial [Actinotignum timonense]|uniref:hypothetical protein n=1 Tax=Actinotignum timonense TaxID=1870995 RepID=UPI0025501844
QKPTLGLFYAPFHKRAHAASVADRPEPLPDCPNLLPAPKEMPRLALAEKFGAKRGFLLVAPT